MSKDCSGVWVFAEQRDGVLQKVSLELLGKGREIADTLGEKLVAVMPGYNVDNLAKTLVAHGADEVLYVNSPLLKNYTTDGYTTVIYNLVMERKPEIVFIGATNIGRDLGPRLAGRIHTGLTADCTGLAVDEETRYLQMTRPAFGGNLMATIECPNHRPQMSTVRPGVFNVPCADERREGKIEVITPALKDTDVRTQVLEVVKSLKDSIDITEADIIVSGGRGVGNKEGFAVLQELADVMGGVVGASRAAVDSGWMDKSHQVGQTGKTVRPQIYIACGISGAIQHLAGMQDSDFIIAINKDENAPIMSVADMAIVGDLYKVVPELTKEVKGLVYSCEMQSK